MFEIPKRLHITVLAPFGGIRAPFATQYRNTELFYNWHEFLLLGLVSVVFSTTFYFRHYYVCGVQSNMTPQRNHKLKVFRLLGEDYAALFAFMELPVPTLLTVSEKLNILEEVFYRLSLTPPDFAKGTTAGHRVSTWEQFFRDHCQISGRNVIRRLAAKPEASYNPSAAKTPKGLPFNGGIQWRKGGVLCH